jgi:hypothetical protein
LSRLSEPVLQSVSIRFKNTTPPQYIVPRIYMLLDLVCGIFEASIKLNLVSMIEKESSRHVRAAATIASNASGSPIKPTDSTIGSTASLAS